MVVEVGWGRFKGPKPQLEQHAAMFYSTKLVCCLQTPMQAFLGKAFKAVLVLTPFPTLPSPPPPPNPPSG